LGLGIVFFGSAAILWFNMNRRLAELLMNLSIGYIPIFLGIVLLGLAMIQRGSGWILPAAASLMAAYLILGLCIGKSLSIALPRKQSGTE
jgi:hypothetical protein